MMGCTLVIVTGVVTSVPFTQIGLVNACLPSLDTAAIAYHCSPLTSSTVSVKSFDVLSSAPAYVVCETRFFIAKRPVPSPCPCSRTRRCS